MDKFSWKRIAIAAIGILTGILIVLTITWPVDKTGIVVPAVDLEALGELDELPNTVTGRCEYGDLSEETLDKIEELSGEEAQECSKTTQEIGWQILLGAIGIFVILAVLGLLFALAMKNVTAPAWVMVAAIVGALIIGGAFGSGLVDWIDDPDLTAHLIARGLLIDVWLFLCAFTVHKFDTVD